MNRIFEIAQLPKKRIIGLMSGTSADGVDTALVEIEGSGLETKLQLLCFHFSPFSKDIRQQISELFSPKSGSVDKICQVNFLLGELFATAALEVIRKSGLPLSSIHLIASHGQTIYHIPPSMNSGIPSTLQIGEPTVIAHKTGIPVIADFRVADVAVGGEGAPLVPYADFLLFRDERKAIATQNIGGISNVTVIPANAQIDDVLAFDTGPGNMLIDEATKLLTEGKYNYDPDGAIAATGRTNVMLLDELMEHPFISAKPPKSTGRETFGLHYALEVIQKAGLQNMENAEILATLTEFTAKSIYENYVQFVFPHHNLSEVILSGGGIHNRTLMKSLKQYFGHIPLVKSDDYGIPSDAKEAIAFAILAHETLANHPGNIPKVTGAQRPVILGKIIPV
ncbi:anhydro-N-acetylmuramic acid kinase [Candidatus Poribacteria bacterium]|nr:anhydro-N-acetylmuramic acid kinase [Candidatus Poribacteria bacterium]